MRSLITRFEHRGEGDIGMAMLSTVAQPQRRQFAQCGLKVLPVSSSVFKRERMRGHPSEQNA